MQNGHDPNAPTIIRGPLIAPNPTQSTEDMFRAIVDNLRRAIGANGGQLPVADPAVILGQALIIERLDKLLATLTPATQKPGVHRTVVP